MKNPDFTESSGTGTVSLTRYDAASRALAEARSVDEVLDVRNFAMAMEFYAKQAKDPTLINDATDIRLRAELRLGEMILAQKESVGLATGAAGIGRAASAVPEEYRTQPPTLAEAGIDKKLSARVQQLARLSPAEREVRFSAAKKESCRVCSRTMVRMRMDLLLWRGSEVRR
jgi:hypothetical protein